MSLVIIWMSLVTICYTLFVTLLFLKEDVSIIKRIISIIVLICLFSLTFYDMRLYRYFIDNEYMELLSLLIATCVSIYLIIKAINNRKRISDLSIKNAIDLSSNGIMFLKNNKVIVNNNMMQDILNDLDIKENYIDSLLKYVNQYGYINCLDKYWQLKYNRNEIILLDVTDIYKLMIETNEKNKLVEENNKKLIKTISILEDLEKEENLIKLKNEFHDLLGHRLSLFSQYLNENRVDKEDVKVMLTNILENDKDKKANILLNELVNMYKVFNIKINVEGKLPFDESVSKIYYEVIREAVTNAVIHGDSKNIDVIINEKEMIIINDGINYNKVINENEGLKGIRRKLKKINRELFIDNKDKFKLIIKLK